MKKLVTDTDKKVKEYNDHNTTKPANNKEFNSQYKSLKKAFLSDDRDINALYKMATYIGKVTDSIKGAQKIIKKYNL